jgi:hypothetical protein
MSREFLWCGQPAGLNRRTARVTLVLGAVMMAFAVIGAASASAAPAVDVYVSYADTARAAPTAFPTPWDASPNTTFNGCKPAASCEYDAGAIRVVNNTSISQKVDSVVAHFGPTCTYDIWPHDVTLAPGAQLIVTQTTTGATTGCAPGTGNMDSSDIGPGGVSWSGHCNDSGITPTIDISLNGTPTTYTDSARVLNTKGIDQAACGVLNESAQWSKIGTQTCPGAALTLAPPSQTHRVGETASLTATFANSCGDPLSNVTVGFQIGAGPNAGLTRAGTTDSAGHVTVSYTSSKTGTDQWFAAVHNPAGFIFSGEADVTWRAGLLYTGRAYDGSIKLLGLNPIMINDTGEIATPNASDRVVKTVDLQGPPVWLTVLPAEVATGDGASAAWAGVASARIGIPGVPVIAASAVNTSSGTTCAGSAGTTSIASLTIGGQGINVNDLAPNTTIPLLLPGAKLVLNERISAPGELTVNAIHLIVPGIADVVIASSKSDIHNC